MSEARRWGVVAVGTVVATYACLWILRFTLHAVLDAFLAVVAVCAVAWGLRMRQAVRRGGWAVALRGSLRRT